MKKNLLIAFALIFSGSLFAQNFQAVNKGEVKLNKTNVPMALKSTLTADTITDYMDRASDFKIYTLTTGGYIFGNNASWTETSMQYDAIANASLTDIIFWVAAKEIVGTTDNLDINVYGDNAGAPGTQLGTMTYGMDQIDTAAQFNTIHFATPVDLLGNMFYVGFNLAGDDTIGCVCNDPDSLDGQGEERSFLNYNGTWYTMNAGLQGGFDADGIYMPIVDVTVGANYMEDNGLKIYRSYPNPTNSISNIKYGIESTQTVNVKVFDITGKTIFANASTQTAGSHIIPVDFSSYPAGTYFYTVSTNSSKITSKISVIK